MSALDQKRGAARAALDYLVPGTILGVGTGSTVDCFIDLLAELGAERPRQAVSSSEATSGRLRQLGIEVLDLNDIDRYPVYVDGADEFEPGLAVLKGGGAALTREKIVAGAAERFVCIVDASKQVEVLGTFPLPVEVLPIAREQVARRLRTLGGKPRLRPGTITDEGNQILDVHGLRIVDPRALEVEIDATPGVVSCGIFARRGADIVLMGTDDGVRMFERS